MAWTRADAEHSSCFRPSSVIPAATIPAAGTRAQRQGGGGEGLRPVPWPLSLRAALPPSLWAVRLVALLWLLTRTHCSY